MNRKVIDIIFAFLVFALPFKYIPRILWQTTLGGPFGNDLVVYPLLIGFVYTFYCQWKYRNVFFKWGIFKKFILAYVGVLLVSLIWGLINYPYYDQILAGPADQIEKLPKVLALLHGIGIPIAQKTLLEIWMLARPIKGVFFEALYTFGAAYMIFCWYHDRVQRAIDILLKVTTVDLIIIAAYGLVDVCYQNGQMWAQNALMVLNPIMHADVSTKWIATGFHPSMFRDAQNRSLFLEPSYYGIYMAFAYPLLWWNIFRAQSKLKKVSLYTLFCILTFEIFLSQSRLAIAVNLGIFVLFAIISLYKMQKMLLVLLAALCIGSGICFAGSIEFLQVAQVPSQMGAGAPLATKKLESLHKTQTINKSEQQASVNGTSKEKAKVDSRKKEKAKVDSRKKEKAKVDSRKKEKTEVDSRRYLENTLGTISSANVKGDHAGSNHSRFTIQKTHIQIGMQHPLLGVGTSLRTGYVRQMLDRDEGTEIKNWNSRIDKFGILRNGYANLGEFSLRFAETGIIGVGLFVFPAIYLFWQVGKFLLKRNKDSKKSIPCIFSSLSYIGMLSTGLGDGINLTFCYWIAMTILFLILEYLRKDN